ncbi:hypothetical protein ATCC90586_000771 [Pythium insidiosum]|nr:hypothetical protein ATCC90586_000771 [Pythium insidiosum]
MNLAQLQPANTQKAKTLAQNVFKRFLHDQHVQMEDVASAVQGDPTGSILVSLLDRFGVHLAFQEGKKGEKLAHTTVMQYFRQAKLASSASDYQDVALLALLWYLFGRTSDLTFLKKQNLSMTGANVLFLRFVRVKTSQENGISIFPDAYVNRLLAKIAKPAGVTSTLTSLVVTLSPDTGAEHSKGL